MTRTNQEMVQIFLFGHYARILVDVDLSKRIFEEVMVERERYAFYVTIVYERLPEFSSNCYTIGHSVALCNKLHPKSMDDKPKAKKHKKKGDSSKQPITIHDDQPPRDPPKIQRCHQQMYLRCYYREQHTNRQPQEVPMQLPNYAPATDDDAQDRRKVMEDDAQESRKVMEDDTHNSNDTEVPEANDDFEHHQEDHASSDSTNSETVSSTQVPQVHSSGPILKKVAMDDIEKIQKAWAAGDS